MQYKAFMIKYAEIGTKGKNRYIFEDILVKNINRKIKIMVIFISARNREGSLLKQNQTMIMKM